ncbi:SigB/SigF/SigG family RNA polymerase sigma factor [Streptomyces sp. OE57]|uniref:SigB/SigF/SigG family RNA polymerase sigma factor n=1 Tax=Streptomyces lacaronensis TaxID=3379885 RepID=UPI0039B77533
MTSVRAHPRAHPRHPHDDVPDTSAEFRRIATLPDGPSKEALRQDVVRAWMPMAERLAGQFRNRGEATEDLRQVAMVGLVKAVRRYDPDRGSAFESYAVPTVVGEVKRHFRDHLWGVHVPRGVQELRARVRDAVQELTRSPDAPTPKVADIAAHTGLSEEEVRAGMEARGSFAPLSLDAEPRGADDGFGLMDTLGSTEPSYERVVQRESLKPCLRRLSERERKILYLRFFCDETQSRIAGRLGISQMQVSRLLSDTCARLGRQAGARGV